MITKVNELISKLPPTERNLCERLFLVSSGIGQLQVPPHKRASVEEIFGSYRTVERQQIVRITNRVTLETTIYNELRSSRPQQVDKSLDLEKLVEAGRGQADPFNQPTEDTTADIFGRVEGAYSVTASNIAKLETWHGVVVFNEFHPHKFGPEQVIDYLLTAREWAEVAHQKDPKAIYYLFLWNCLWKAGSSVIHGHAQMCLGRDMHYGKIERLRRDAVTYRERHKRSYFNDLVQAHRALGLTADPVDMVKALTYLTPTRNREIILLTDLYSPELGEALYKILAYYQSLGVTSFNVVVQMPPIRPSAEDWNGFPVLVRIVDRGDPRNRGNDVGAIDLFAAEAVINDPFTLARGLREWLHRNR
ncbi:MAG: hypothetical protein WCS37_20860 [Chloroflexota bacterium]|nr:hypothetical protein [Chloroflexota bacterium]